MAGVACKSCGQRHPSGSKFMEIGGTIIFTTCSVRFAQQIAMTRAIEELISEQGVVE